MPTRKGAFDYPAPGQNLEGLLPRFLRDNLQADARCLGRFSGDVRGVGTIDPHHIQVRIERLQMRQDLLGPARLAQAGFQNENFKEEALRIYADEALAPGDLLARIVAPGIPLFSAVLADWLSLDPAAGCTFRFEFFRVWSRSASCT